MIERINILHIVKDHFSTLRNMRDVKGGITWPDFLLFLVMPLCLSCTLVYMNYNFDKQVSNLIAAISIFGGFLFNLLAIIYGQFDKIEKEIKDNHNSNKVKLTFLKEIHANISF
jgi:hypothetical protein